VHCIEGRLEYVWVQHQRIKSLPIDSFPDSRFPAQRSFAQWESENESKYPAMARGDSWPGYQHKEVVNTAG